MTSSLLWALLTSHSSLLLRLMRPPVRSPRLRRALFPLIYLPHLLVLPATFGLHRFQPTYPYFPALYVVPVRQAKGLPTASFRFHLTMDTLAVQLCTSLLLTRTRDFHPLERAHGAQTKRTTGRFPVSGSCLFTCNHDWLIKAGFFRELPHDPAAAGSQQELRQLLSAYSPVGALELADRERFFIGDYILDQIIPVLFPVRPRIVSCFITDNARFFLYCLFA